MTKSAFIMAHDGHVFACKYVAKDVVLTNAYGCQTRLSLSHAKRILQGTRKMQSSKGPKRVVNLSQGWDS